MACSLWRGNQILGPVLGGLLFSAATPAPFLFDAVTFGLAAVLIAAIGPIGDEEEGDPVATSSAIREIRSAGRWLLESRVLRSLLILTMVGSIAVTAYWAPLVLVAQERMGISPSFYGLFLSSIAVGSLAGAGVASVAAERLGSRSGIALSAAVFGLAVVALGLTTSWVLGALSISVIGVAVVVWNVLAVSLRQALIPDQMIGRVTAIFRAGSWGLMPLGAILGGATAELIDLAAPYVIFGSLVVLTAVGTWVSLGSADIDSLRSHGRLPADDSPIPRTADRSATEQDERR